MIKCYHNFRGWHKITDSSFNNKPVIPVSPFFGEYRNPLAERGDSGTSPAKKQRDTAGMTRKG